MSGRGKGGKGLSKKAEPKAEPKAKPKSDSEVDEKIEIEIESKNSDSEVEKPKNKTKRAPSAYNLYIKDKIAELRESNPGLIPKEYMKMAVAQYNLEHPKSEDEAKPKKERKPRQKKSESKTKDSEDKAKPKKERKPRAPTVYNLFIKDAMAKLKASEEEMKPQERMKRAVEMWKKLSDEDKEDFKQSLIVEQEAEE